MPPTQPYLPTRAIQYDGVRFTAKEEQRHRRESLEDKLFQHKKKGGSGEGRGSGGQGEGNKEKKGEGEVMRKFENEIKEDEKQEADGGEYGGSMG